MCLSNIPTLCQNELKNIKFTDTFVMKISILCLVLGELMWEKSWYFEDVSAQYCFLFKLQVISRIVRKKRNWDFYLFIFLLNHAI